MSDEQILQDEALVEAVAEGLKQAGFAAAAQDTGGDILCVVIEQVGGEVTRGTADVTWGAVVTNEDGDFVSAIRTTCPSDSTDIPAIVEALRNASLAHGVVLE